MTGLSLISEVISRRMHTDFSGMMPEEVLEIVDDLTNKSGDTDVILRQQVFWRGMVHLGFSAIDTVVPKNLAHYVDMIAQGRAVNSKDVQLLLDEGWSETELLEITAVAAMSAGYGRLQIAWTALHNLRQNDSEV